MHKINISKGDRINKLTILSEIEKKGKERQFTCVCDCGKRVKVRLNNLRSGNTKSCGCLKTTTEETKEKIRRTMNRRVKAGRHNMWKGVLAGYDAKHMFIKKHYGKAKKCENPKCRYPRYNKKGRLMHRPKRYEWANTTGTYTHNVEDYIQLCPSCHRLYDNGKLKL